jgi:hypothetical protein
MQDQRIFKVSLDPLPPATIARLAGIKLDSMRKKRFRGNPLTDDQLEEIMCWMLLLLMRAWHLREKK